MIYGEKRRPCAAAACVTAVWEGEQLRCFQCSEGGQKRAPRRPPEAALSISRRGSGGSATSTRALGSPSNNAAPVFVVSTSAEGEAAAAALCGCSPLLAASPLASFLACRHFQRKHEELLRGPAAAADSACVPVTADHESGSKSAPPRLTGATPEFAEPPTAQTADAADPPLLIGCDTEGVLLGRFGRLCIVQMGGPHGGPPLDPLLLIDALKESSLSPSVRQILEGDSILKIFHDCREDSAALFHQHDIRLDFVFDTQVAHQLICAKRGEALYQASLKELVEAYLGITIKGLEAGRELLDADLAAFAKRPLSAPLLRYAALGVRYLPRLAMAMSLHIRPEEVIAASQEYVLYRHLNEAFKCHRDMAKKGTLLEGMVVVRSPEKIILKLNTSAVGIVCSPAALERFQDVQFGDIVAVSVAGEGAGGKYLYVERHDGLFDFTDPKRPRRNYATSMQLTEDCRADPLLLAHLDD
ncbi:uncharacterized protein LOC34619134 [Cyclospora cayetanensis]|uniref:Uncharacterized protein LOC34619134 n=1 Tax=Cyclospora cayetanensis TaxID=88456 RepID=A0A6P6RZ46_9EIME|nr:uncharacterized protein LOC34619134 [Cyclospora cayetanensis]